MPEPVYTDDLLILISRCYYIDNVPQAQIAKMVNVSQSKISRLLSLARTSEASEVIHWYQYQIAAKIIRGLMGRKDEEEEQWEEDIPKDSDGSIKVALIAMDRSISAWRIMQMSLADRADSIVPMLVALERLRQATEQTFPEAKDFIRPGFDEISDQLIN